MAIEMAVGREEEDPESWPTSERHVGARARAEGGSPASAPPDPITGKLASQVPHLGPCVRGAACGRLDHGGRGFNGGGRRPGADRRVGSRKPSLPSASLAARP